METDIQHPALLAEIETFLGVTGMGVTYFGKRAAKDSSVVARLRRGGSVSPRIERRLRAFMESRRQPAPIREMSRAPADVGGDSA